MFSGGFGASSAPAYGDGGGGFGQAPTPAFGAPPSTPAFGVSSGFGAPPTGASFTPGFGASSSTPAFGASSSPTFGSGSFGASTSSVPAFGAPPPAIGAVAPAPPPSPFGAPASGSLFGGASTWNTLGASPSTPSSMPGVGTFSAPQLFSAPSNFVASSVSQPSGAPNPLVPPTLWCPQHSGAPQPFGAPIAPQPYGGLQPSGAPQTFGAPSASQPFGAPQSFGAPSAPQPFLATSSSSTPPLASGTGLFGSPAPSFSPSGSTSGPGSRIVPFRNTVKREDCATPGAVTRGNCMSITAMPEYLNKSVEELRFEDYQANARCGPWVGPIPQRQPADFSPFGGPASISSTPPLASGTGLFGPAPSFGPSGSTSVPGSRIVPFQMTVQRDGTAGNETMGNYMSITAMPEYTNKSVEELRSEDYQANARCGPWVGPIPLRQLAASSLSEAPGPSNQSRAREPNQSRARQLSQSRTRAQDSVVFMQALPGESDIEFANRLAFTLSGRAPTSSRPSLPSGRPPPASQPSMPSQGVPPSSRLSLPSHGVPPSSQPLLHTGGSSAPAHPPNQSQGGSSSPTHPPNQSQGEDDTQCVICLSAPRECGFLHGSSVHRCVCRNCKRHTPPGQHCPMCRQTIERVIDVF